MQQGIYVAIVLSVLIFIGLLVGIDWILGNMNLEASVQTIAKSYIHTMCAGLIPLFLFLSCAALSMHLDRLASQ